MADGVVNDKDVASGAVLLEDSDPLIASDLNLIIEAYESGLQESMTEDGLIASIQGILSKQKLILVSVDGLLSEYTGVSATEDIATSNLEGNHMAASIVAQAGLGVDLFRDCVQCDGRISFNLQSLPLPNLGFLLDNLLASIELTLKKLEALLDPTQFYKDICALLDALRHLCPQDILLLLALLTYLITYYGGLLTKLNLDWLSVIGALLFPLITLLYIMLDISGGISVAPLRCNIALIDSFVSQSQALAEATNGVQSRVKLQVPNGSGFQELKSSFMDFTAIEKFSVLLTDAKNTIESTRKRYEQALLVLSSLMGKTYETRVELLTIIITLIRFVTLIRALVAVLKNNELCSDPSVQTTEQDVENLIGRLDLPGSLSLKVDTGTLVVKDLVLNIQRTVPTCFSKLSGSESVQLQQWIEQLDKLAV